MSHGDTCQSLDVDTCQDVGSILTPGTFQLGYVFFFRNSFIVGLRYVSGGRSELFTRARMLLL